MVPGTVNTLLFSENESNSLLSRNMLLLVPNNKSLSFQLFVCYCLSLRCSIPEVSPIQSGLYMRIAS